VAVSFGFKLLHAKYAAVGAFNFVFANLIFILFWSLNSDEWPYWRIASIVTVISALFSYSTQNFLTFRYEGHSIKRMAKYVFMQLLWLPLGILVVPRIALNFEMPIVLVQVLFTTCVVCVNWLILSVNSKK
jgi:putative flippase GtrA